MRTLIPFHVLAGALAIIAGFIALYAFKGGGLHRKSGIVFVYTMLVMSLSGAAMAVGHSSAAVNIPAGLVTAYLVITALATVRPATEASRQMDRIAMIAAFAFGLVSLTLAFTIRGGSPLFMFGIVALLAATGDLRMIRAGGLSGAPRLKRHLWRMCAALFVASGSFFLGPVRRIPEPLRIPAFRLIPLVAILAIVYWLWRLRRRRVNSTTLPVLVRAD